MKSRASGSIAAIRALFFDPSDPGGATRRFLDSRASVWIFGSTLVLAGLAGISHSLVYGWWISRTSTASFAGDDRLYDAFLVLTGLHTLLVSAGLLGLHVLLVKRYRWTRWLSAVGTLLVVASGAGLCAGALYEVLFEPTYYSTRGTLNVLAVFGYFGQPAGVALLGVAALWSRGLGRWRALPLFAGLVGSPLSQIVLWWLFPPGDALVTGEDTREALAEALRFASPVALAGIGWISVGFAVFGVRERETVLRTKEWRRTEIESLSLARRLYEEAWGIGDVTVLDELAAPDFFDRRHGRYGPEGLKRAIVDLRRTFPDLDFSIAERHAEGDTVTTRCRFSGTDRGGLLWYPPTGKHADFTVTYTDRFSKGELVEHDGGADMDDLLRQLGLTHPAGNDHGRQRSS